MNEEMAAWITSIAERVSAAEGFIDCIEDKEGFAQMAKNQIAGIWKECVVVLEENGYADRKGGMKHGSNLNAFKVQLEEIHREQMERIKNK